MLHTGGQSAVEQVEVETQRQRLGEQAELCAAHMNNDTGVVSARHAVASSRTRGAARSRRVGGGRDTPVGTVPVSPCEVARMLWQCGGSARHAEMSSGAPHAPRGATTSTTAKAADAARKARASMPVLTADAPRRHIGATGAMARDARGNEKDGPARVARLRPPPAPAMLMTMFTTASARCDYGADTSTIRRSPGSREIVYCRLVMKLREIPYGYWEFDRHTS